MNPPKTGYCTKLIQSGHYLELFEFKKTIRSPLIDPFRVRSLISPKTLRMDNILSSKKKLIRIINSNYTLNKFITLTYSQNINDLKISNRLFSKFIMRLKYHHFPNLQYIAVPEYQKRGAIHYHFLTNFDYLHNNIIAKIWTYGFTTTKQLKHISNVGGYMTKYMTKTFNDTRFLGQKKYFRSKNLQLPSTTYDQQALSLYNFLLPECEIMKKIQVNSEWIGQINITYLKIKKLALMEN